MRQLVPRDLPQEAAPLRPTQVCAQSLEGALVFSLFLFLSIHALSELQVKSKPDSLHGRRLYHKCQVTKKCHIGLPSSCPGSPVPTCITPVTVLLGRAVMILLSQPKQPRLQEEGWLRQGHRAVSGGGPGPGHLCHEVGLRCTPLLGHQGFPSLRLTPQQLLITSADIPILMYHILALLASHCSPGVKEAGEGWSHSDGLGSLALVPSQPGAAHWRHLPQTSSTDLLPSHCLSQMPLAGLPGPPGCELILPACGSLKLKSLNSLHRYIQFLPLCNLPMVQKDRQSYGSNQSLPGSQGSKRRRSGVRGQ